MKKITWVALVELTFSANIDGIDEDEAVRRLEESQYSFEREVTNDLLADDVKIISSKYSITESNEEDK